jgi:hypothetical protein
VFTFSGSHEERLRVAGEHLSRELFEELRALGQPGRMILEAALEKEKPHQPSMLFATMNLAVGMLDGVLLGVIGLLGERCKPEDNIPDHLFPPRREVVFDVLGKLASKWMFEDEESKRPPDPLLPPEKLGAEPAPEPEAPKVGRNDPCPCGSGKKYKKCCEAKLSAPRLRTPAELLRKATYQRNYYALDFAQQIALWGEARVREHLEVLADPELRQELRNGDPYLKLACLARAAHVLDAAPRWTVPLALDLVEGPGTPAADRAFVGSFAILKSESDEVAARVVAAVSRADDLTPIGLTQLAGTLLVHTPDKPDLAIQVTLLPAAKGDPRLDLVRALSHRAVKNEPGEREALEIVREKLKDHPKRRDVLIAVEECLASYGDKPLGERHVIPIEERATIVEPPPAPTPETRPARKAAYVDASLEETARAANAAAKAVSKRIEGEVDAARREVEVAHARALDLERQLEEARIQAGRTRRALVLKETALGESRSAELASPTAQLVEALERAQAAFLDRVKNFHLRDELPIAVVAARAGRRGAILLPLPPSVLRREGEAAAFDMALASIAALAEVEFERARSIVPADVNGRLALLVDTPEIWGEGEAQERFDLWAAALDDAWGKLERVVSLSTVPQLHPIVGPVAENILKVAKEIELVPSPVAPPETAAASGKLADALTAFPRPFFVVRELGARGIFAGDRLSASVLETLRKDLGLDQPRPTAEAPAVEWFGGKDPLDDDPHDARRVLRVLLRRLIRFGKIGGSHTRLDNAVSGAPPHLRGTVRDAMNDLIALEVLRPKPTLTGLHISIEPPRISEVDTVVKTGEIPWPRVRDRLGVS